MCVCLSLSSQSRLFPLAALRAYRSRRRTRQSSSVIIYYAKGNKSRPHKGGQTRARVCLSFIVSLSLSLARRLCPKKSGKFVSVGTIIPSTRKECVRPSLSLSLFLPICPQLFIDFKAHRVLRITKHGITVERAREKRRERESEAAQSGGGRQGADVGSHYVEGGDVTDGDGWLRVRQSINPMVPNKLLQL